MSRNESYKKVCFFISEIEMSTLPTRTDTGQFERLEEDESWLCVQLHLLFTFTTFIAADFKNNKLQIFTYKSPQADLYIMFSMCSHCYVYSLSNLKLFTNILEKQIH